MGSSFSKLYTLFVSKTSLGIYTALAFAIYYWWKGKKYLPLKLPRNAQEITLEFLHKYYSKKITSFKITPLTAEVREGIEREDGGGISGASLAKISFESTDSTVPQNAIVKINDTDSAPANNFKARFLAIVWGVDINILNATEVIVFRQARKIFDEANVRIPKTFLTLSSHKLDEVPLRNALMFLLFDFRTSYQTFIICEDFSKTHKSWPQGVGLHKAKVIAALENISRLHALNYKNFQNKDELKLLPKTNVWYQNIMIGANASNLVNKSMRNIHVDNSIEKTIKNWTGKSSENILKKVELAQVFKDPKVQDAVWALRDLCKNKGFYDLVLDILEPQTCLHGDFHGWNHIFPKDEAKTIDKDDVVLVDFQITSLGRIAWELVYFLNFSVDYVSFEQDKQYFDRYYSTFKAQEDKNIKVKEYTKEMFYREVYLTQILCGIKWLSMGTADHVGPKYWKNLYKKNKKGQGGTFAGLRYFSRVMLRLKGLHENNMLEFERYTTHTKK